MPSSSYFTMTAKPPFRDLIGRFIKATDNLPVRQRDMLRGEGRRFVQLAGQESPGGPSGSIGKGITFKTFSTGRNPILRVYAGKIGTWHMQGTGIYGPRKKLIKGLSGQPLRFEIGGEILYRMWVRGIKPNKIFGRAYRRWLPGARSALKTLANQWVKDISGQTKGVSV